MQTSGRLTIGCCCMVKSKFHFFCQVENQVFDQKKLRSDFWLSFEQVENESSIFSDRNLVKAWFINTELYSSVKW